MMTSLRNLLYLTEWKAGFTRLNAAVCSALVAALYYHIVGWLGMLSGATGR